MIVHFYVISENATPNTELISANNTQNSSKIVQN